MDYLLPVLMFVLGIALGSLALWLVFRSKAKHEYDRARSQTEAERATLTERLAGKETQLVELRAALEKERAENEERADENTQLRTELAAQTTQLVEERKAAEEKLAAFDELEKKLTDTFKALSADALQSNNRSFIDLAKATLAKEQETAKGDLELRRNAIDEMVKPLRESLDRVDGKIGELEKNRIGAYVELREQMKSLATSHQQLQAETGNLVKALRAPQARGRWGEIQLRRVVELAGMLEYCDFAEQESFATEESRQRPDLIVRLPGNRTIVVDSKVPFDAFYESISTTDDVVRLAKLKDHARHVRTHISQLSKKSYWEAVKPTPEFVLLFLPGETFYSAALENDPKLIEDGVNQGVIIATPTTLIALLKAVSYGWRQEQMAANAQEVSELGKKLHDRLRTFAGYFADIGRGLDRAIESFNKGVGSFESRVLVTARLFKDCGAIPGAEIDVLESVDKTSRTLGDGGALLEEGELEQIAPVSIASERPEEAAAQGGE
jgi:DNA recombination protein RmuC